MQLANQERITIPGGLQEESFAGMEKDGRVLPAEDDRVSVRVGSLDAEIQLEQAVFSSPARQRFLSEHPGTVETRGLLKVSPEALPNHLTARTLAGRNRISVSPYVLVDNERGCLLAYYHLGDSLSGHKGLVHGGLQATLLDECMGRACFPLLPEKSAVTAHFELDYRNPIKADSVILIRAETERVEGRKAWTKGTVEAVGENDGQVLVESKALFVQPRWVAGMELLM